MYWSYSILSLIGPGLALHIDTRISRANLDGSGAEDLVTGLDSAEIALDVTASKMYWVADGDKIQRANLDGSGVEDLVTGLDDPNSIALDVTASKMYWVDSGKIQRANLDGSGVEDLVTGVDSLTSIALDVTAGKMYWVDGAYSGYTKIRRADLDGSGVEDLAIGISSASKIALDAAAGKIYSMGNSGELEIHWINLDVSSSEGFIFFFTFIAEPTDIALDAAADKLYFTLYGGSHLHPPISIGSIWTAAVPKPSSPGSTASRLPSPWTWRRARCTGRPVRARSNGPI